MTQQVRRYRRRNQQYFIRFLASKILIFSLFVIISLSLVKNESYTTLFVVASSSKTRSSSRGTPSSSSKGSNSNSDKTNNFDSKDDISTQQGVIQLTSRNFDSNLRDGSAWLIEFYAPWCGHCKQFAPQYEAVALHFHKRNKKIEEEKENNSNSDNNVDSSSEKTQNNNKKSKEKREVKVGQVDATSERALAHRFNVKAYPSFFLVDGWTVREYKGYRRSQQSMIEFVDKTHTKTDPIPMMASPFGPIGLVRSLIMSIGTMLLDVHDWLVDSFGFSPMVAASLVAIGGVLVSLITIISIGLFTVSKMKID
eukprot:CAMPEP_0178962364 /NCGR_PEP_ID=MMETSP0789-20121207/14314_1 /TAXON_ID=3005 /ORGANISM="Rhizosolenia setigera, Strain CCMP 1694" /LENGTH=309 /DNA_ID=CAMNT_0020646487 /DNA_START=105 /DNA_END=1034 /DNA_ORIENTATION=-